MIVSMINTCICIHMRINSKHVSEKFGQATSALTLSVAALAATGRAQRTQRKAAEMAKLPKHMQPVDTKQGPRGSERQGQGMSLVH